MQEGHQGRGEEAITGVNWIDQGTRVGLGLPELVACFKLSMDFACWVDGRREVHHPARVSKALENQSCGSVQRNIICHGVQVVQKALSTSGTARKEDFLRGAQGIRLCEEGGEHSGDNIAASELPQSIVDQTRSRSRPCVRCAVRDINEVDTCPVRAKLGVSAEDAARRNRFRPTKRRNHVLIATEARGVVPAPPTTLQMDNPSIREGSARRKVVARGGSIVTRSPRVDGKVESLEREAGAD